VHVVITAGPTREYLDDVRFLASGSTGRMGFAVARAFAKAGHRVTLVTGPVELRDPAGVETVRVVTAREMNKAVRAVWPEVDAMVATAAVSDYRPASRRRGKWKKGPETLDLPMVRNPDILGGCGKRKGNRVLVGFAVEVQRPLEGGRAKMGSKNLDALCLCGPPAFAANAADYRILRPDGSVEPLPGIRKDRLAGRIVTLVQGLHEQRFSAR
jgi:phosphopantothenoylcysteine decarboxylase/phosphopantothenate--cysteine ligase